MLFTFYIQTISILLTVNILFFKYLNNAYYPHMLNFNKNLYF